MHIELKFEDNSKLNFNTKKRLTSWKEIEKKLETTGLEGLTVTGNSLQSEEDKEEQKQNKEDVEIDIQFLHGLTTALKKNKERHIIKSISLYEINLEDKSAAILIEIIAAS